MFLLYLTWTWSHCLLIHPVVYFLINDIHELQCLFVDVVVNAVYRSGALYLQLCLWAQSLQLEESPFWGILMRTVTSLLVTRSVRLGITSPM